MVFVQESSPEEATVNFSSSFVGAMRTKAELEALNAAQSGSEYAHSFLTESQRAALDAALAAKQTAPGNTAIALDMHSGSSLCVADANSRCSCIV